jgi:hypothetical protein
MWRPHASTLDPATLRRDDVRMEPFHEGVYVVYPDTRSGEEVSAARVVPRDE